MNSCNTDIFFGNYYHLQSVRFEYDSFHNYSPQVPTRKGPPWELYKMAVSLANIFMAKIETTLIQQSETKLNEWRRYLLPLGQW